MIANDDKELMGLLLSKEDKNEGRSTSVFLRARTEKLELSFALLRGIFIHQLPLREDPSLRGVANFWSQVHIRSSQILKNLQKISDPQIRGKFDLAPEKDILADLKQFVNWKTIVYEDI